MRLCAYDAARLLFVALAVTGFFGCDSGGGKGGNGPFGSYTPRDPAEATAQADSALTECSSSCSANVTAGRAALAEGDLEAALDAYACASTPEAAFGAGLTTLLVAVESERGDQVLADFGIEPFSASDLIGPDGYLSRHAARREGGGTLALGGDITHELTLTEALAPEQAESFDRGSLTTSGGDASLQVRMEVYNYGLISPGTAKPLLYDCAAGATSATLLTELPTIFFSIEDHEGGGSYECDIAFSRDLSFCQQEAGMIANDSAGARIGDQVSLTFTEVGLSCFAFDGSVAGLTQNITITGTVTATISGEVDTSDLHMFFRDDAEYELGSIPADVTINDLLAHAAALTGDLAKAACLFERAADGDGEVLSVPGELFGGDDIGLRSADAKLLGALAAAGAAALQIGGAYASELPLRDVACMLAEGDDDSGACGEVSGHVTMVNAAIESAGVRSDRLAAARVFLAAGLEGFLAAVPMQDETTVFPRNASSAAGWDAMAQLATAFERSLSDGETALPFVSPSVRINLRELLTSPPKPADIALIAFNYQEECDDFDCYSSLELSPTFCTRLWSPLGLDFDGDYETSEEADHIEDAFEAFSSSLESREVLRGL
jgi:hypothetical protein